MVLMIIPFKDLGLVKKEVERLIPDNYRVDVMDFYGIGKILVVTIDEAWYVEEEYNRSWDTYDAEKAESIFNYNEAFGIIKKIAESEVSENIGLIIVTLVPFYYPWGPAHFNDPEYIRGFWINKKVLKKPVPTLSYTLNHLKGCLGVPLIEIILPFEEIFKIIITKRNEYIIHIGEGFYVKCGKNFI